MKKRYTILVLILLVPITLQLLGYHISYIATESMVPTLVPGDLIIAKTIRADKISVGDIIIFNSDSRAICHRVVNISGSRITTKGDANPKNDPSFTTNHSHGKLQIVCKRIPYFGYPFAFLQNRAFQTALLISLIIGFLIKKYLERRN